MNAEEGWARVEPGLTRDELNDRLAGYGLHFAPDPATTSSANIGGMIGNNSSGARSILYGKISDHLIEAKVLLADGTIMALTEYSFAEYERISRGEDQTSRIFHRFRRLIEDHRDEIAKRYPKVMRRVVGYNLDAFIHGDSWNMAQLFAGSEGTLGVLLEAKIKLEPLPAYSVMSVPHFPGLRDAIKAVPRIVKHHPSAVEILDRKTLTLARKNPGTADLCDFIQGDPAAVLIVEFLGDSREEVAARAKVIADELRVCGAVPLYTSAEDQARIWRMRKAGLGLLLRTKGKRKPIPFIEDASVPLGGVGGLYRRRGRDLPSF